MATPESKVKAKIKELCKAYGVYYAMPVMAGMATNGTPDFLMCVGGQFVAVEAKANGGKPTKLQELRMQEIAAAGGIVRVIDEKNLYELENILVALGRIKHDSTQAK